MFRGAIAAGHPATAGAAAEMLADGGNAFDAVLAAMVMACVAEPVLASVGGGGFLLARPVAGRNAGRDSVFDFFAQTPRQARPASDVEFYPVIADFGEAQQEFHIGRGAVATPGVVRGLFEAHRALGSLPMRRIVEPAVAAARDGLAMAPMQAYFAGIIRPIVTSTEDCRRLFRSPHEPDRLIAAGETLCNPALADTLEVLAIEGEDLFYRGEIAAAIGRDCGGGAGHLTIEDLESYGVHLRRPLAVDAFGARLLLNPPPSSGGVLIAFALRLLEAAPHDGATWGSPAWLARLCAVMDATNRARVDSRLHERGDDDAAEMLLDPTLVAQYRDHVLGRPAVTRGTTHISVIDAAGNAASLSLSNGEGSGYVVPDTGIHMNNVLGEEDINPHGFHCWPPDTRLSSMMTPTLALEADGGVIALGSGGSNRIRTAILQVLANRLLFAMPLAETVEQPRIHFEGGRLSVEPGYAEPAVAACRHLASEIDLWESCNMFFGGVHAARRSARSGLEAAGDPRRAGVGMLA